jgi:hypothetical protein
MTYIIFRACNVHAWFLSCAEPFALHQLHPPYQFPPSGSKPLWLSLIVDYDKANVTGDASVRACGANPIPGQSCFIHWLYEFFLIFPAIDEFTAVFGSIPSKVNTSNKFCTIAFGKRCLLLLLGLAFVSPNKSLVVHVALPLLRLREVGD